MSKVGALADDSSLNVFSLREFLKQISDFLPSGSSLPADVWQSRHRFLLGLTWLHALLIALIGPLLGYSWEFNVDAVFRDGTVLHTIGEALVVAFFGAVAKWGTRQRAAQATAVGFGLMSASAILVHLSGGYIEIHFHFFVMVIFLALYQDWVPYLLAIVYVAIHHGMVGALWPEEVYNHTAALNAPWTWAGIHAFFIVWASVGSIIAWRHNEKAHAQAVGFERETRAALDRILVLHEIGQAITSTLDLQAVLQVLMEKIDRFLPSTAVLVWLINPESGSVERAACWNLDEAEWKGRKLKGTPALVKEAMASKAPVVARNVQTDPRTLDLEFSRRQGLVSYLGLPLVVRGDVLGVLVLLTTEEHQFLKEEIDFLSIVAGQAAIAIHNSQLYEQTRKQGAELERTNQDLKREEEIQALLKELNQDITRLDIDTLLKKLTEKVREILRVDISDVRVLVEGEWKLTGIAGIAPNLLTSGRSGTGRGPAGWIQQHRQPLVIPDINRTDIPTGTTMKNLGLRGYVGVPLFSRGGEMIGVLRALSYQPRDFAQEEIDLLQQLANGCAIALENARLLEEIKRQAVALENSNKAKDELLVVMARQKEELSRLNAGLHREIAERTKARAEIAAKNRDLETLHEIGQIILTSPDLETTLEKILHHALTAGACDIGTIRLLDSKTQTLEPVAHSGYRNSDHVNAHHRNLKEATSGRLTLAMLTEPRPRIVENVQEGEGLRTFKKEGVQSAVVVPVRNRDKVLGALQLGSRRDGKFQPEQIRFLEAIGNQMGIAVEKARLFDEIKKQTLELENSNKTKDELLAAMASQKEELSRLNAGLRSEIAERTKARAEIAAKNRDLETLLYVTSHDLREPLRAIENFSRIVNDRYGEHLDEKGQDFLRRVIQGSQRLTRLLDDILMLSRSQRMGVPTEAVAGETIVQEALKRLEGKVSATNAQVHVAPEFGGLRVDKTWATQAIYNLLVNALKFTRDGEAPDVEIAPYSPEGSGSGVVGIAVRDRGPGVAPEHAERIFQLFQRAVGREVEGTGAGLAIVRQIAERHGGNAWVEPREGGGSQFVITFGQIKGVQGGGRNEC